MLGRCHPGNDQDGFRGRLGGTLPRSRHLPRASTEGSLTRNLHTIEARLRTDQCQVMIDCSFTGEGSSGLGRLRHRREEDSPRFLAANVLPLRVPAGTWQSTCPNGTQRYNAFGIGRRVVVRARCRAGGGGRPQPAKQSCKPLEGR
jgi:hypothetical protein